ncbi:NAC domain-containing protein 41-like [Magnolia sinica]|uniref:NAC domain-containing protein 41-like n=1 Tax=Magnolia sinica TaxID=86752 RepID=UPI002658ABBF|nr:NAC domain-containing protein 41-like [Magnolia sinica]XP_058069133.1 NAC domain-containing protein 41-like [Magnolia sinica]XP_058069134.1 NAC domain-containing protein 41-like [Magnolia sinica]
MRPSALVSPPCIDLNAGDVEMVMHLERMHHGDLPPVNVITEVNPYTVAPDNLPERMLYLCNLEDPRAEARLEGYWQPRGKDDRISTNSPTVGWKTTLEFHTGQAPNGVKTDWLMHEYRMGQRGSSSLCRVFLNNGSQGDTEVDVEGILMRMLETEDNESTNSSQVVSRKEHGQPDVSTNHPHDMGLDHFPLYPPEGYDFSTEDYLELDDLPTSSSISESTCIASMTSDDYFDSEALMCYLENENMTANVPNTEQRRDDCRFNVSASQGPHQMVIQPPPSGSLRSNNNRQTKETMVSATMPKKLRVRDAPLRISASTEPQPNLKVRNHGPKVNMANEGPSNEQGRTSHHVPGERKTDGWMAKLRRKYCCFFPI